MASEIKVDTIVNAGGDNDSGIDLGTNDAVKVTIAGAEKARVDSNGHILVGKTSTGIGTVGAELKATGELLATVNGDACAFLNRTGTDGVMVDLRKDGSSVGEIGIDDNSAFFESTGNRAGLKVRTSDILPRRNSSDNDNGVDLGDSSYRFNDVYAANGVTTTSDKNEKQDIENLTTKELNVAKKLSALFKTYRWIDRVVEKGEKARTHTGIIAQDIQSAFSAEGLDASNYGMFMSDTWTNDDGKEQTRLGVRYPELFSFIFSSIEARLTALESK